MFSMDHSLKPPRGPGAGSWRGCDLLGRGRLFKNCGLFVADRKMLKNWGHPSAGNAALLYLLSGLVLVMR